LKLEISDRKNKPYHIKIKRRERTKVLIKESDTEEWMKKNLEAIMKNSWVMKNKKKGAFIKMIREKRQS